MSKRASASFEDIDIRDNYLHMTPEAKSQMTPEARTRNGQSSLSQAGQSAATGHTLTTTQGVVNPGFQLNEGQIRKKGKQQVFLTW